MLCFTTQEKKEEKEEINSFSVASLRFTRRTDDPFQDSVVDNRLVLERLVIHHLSPTSNQRDAVHGETSALCNDLFEEERSVCGFDFMCLPSSASFNDVNEHSLWETSFSLCEKG